jgi:type IV secretory pathway VirB4 component
MSLRLPRHRATTAQLAGLYPFVSSRALPTSPVILGLDRLGESGVFRFDPFHLYRSGTVTNPNMVVFGEPGSGKSTAVKALTRRLAESQSTFVAVIDPKGEYGALADALGLAVIQLRPGGRDRLNPLDGSGAPDDRPRRIGLLGGLLAIAARRDLVGLEEAALTWIIDELDQQRDTEATLGDVLRLLGDPSPTIAERARRTTADLAAALEPLRLACGRLVERDLAGMFDGPSTVRPDPAGPGVVLDLSALHHDPQALAVVMAAGAAWLQTALAAPRGEHGPRRVQILDEAWALLASERTARYLQACFKLCRAWGVANIAVTHRISDLSAQADDGTATSKIAAGLLADTQTRVVFRQAPDQTPAAQRLLGLTDIQAQLLPSLGRGCALWRIGPGSTHLVEHVLDDDDLPICDTDEALR